MSGNIKFRWFLIVLLGIGLYLSGCAPYYNIARGNDHFGLGNYAKAAHHYELAVSQNPNNFDAHYNLGLAYGELGQSQKAITSLQHAIRIAPNNTLIAEAYNNLGAVYGNLGMYEKAIFYQKQALRLNPNHELARLNLNQNQRSKFKSGDQPRLENEQLLLEEERRKQEALRIDKENRKQRQEPRVPQVYSGTGFLFSAKDYIITNWHVVRGTKNIRVKFLNGESIRATLVLKDSQNDIAFLKLERPPEIPSSNLKIGDSSKVSMGDKVFTIGYPAHWVMGKNPKYTEGVVNAVSGLQDDPTVFQISVQIQPGNSGGPLFNTNGEVVGITTATLDPGFAVEKFRALPQNVNYAIKSNYISTLLPMLPETMLASRGIVVIPAEPEHTLSNFIKKVKKNIVLIEARE